MVGGGRYLSGDDAIRTFAVGEAALLTVTVTWRSGKQTVVTDVAPNQTLVVQEADAVDVEDPYPDRPRVDAEAQWFQDETAQLNHRHFENVFDDFARQPLLPRNLSMPGPGLTWADVDDDGWDDLLIGAAAGGTVTVFRNVEGQSWQRLDSNALKRPLPRDLTTLLFHQGFILGGASNYEDGTSQGGALRLIDIQRGAVGDSLVGEALSAGPLAMADADGDGSLEVFVGARALPGHYPKPATSLLVKTEGGRLRVVQRLEQVGLVQGAVFGDLTGNGRPELILACEWGPVRVFGFHSGALKEITADLGLDKHLGWWLSVGVGDFDGDGRLDIVAGNWGRNDFFAGNPETRPLICRYGELDDTGTFHLIESYHGPDRREWPIRKLGSVAQVWPYVRNHIPTHAKYGESTLTDIYGPGVMELPRVEMNWPESTVFLNRDGRFEARSLPLKAQMSPVTTLAVADWDGDGILDLWLGQNVLPVHFEAARQDAGRGVLLRGDGTGGFESLPAWLTGVEVYGEARGAAVADFDQDGRPDLVVGQNGASTRLFRNRLAKPGVRLDLKGTAQNPRAVGAQIRWLRNGQGVGPVHEITAGSGSLGVDSAQRIVARVPEATHLQIRWPDGRLQQMEVPLDAVRVRASSAR